MASATKHDDIKRGYKVLQARKRPVGDHGSLGSIAGNKVFTASNHIPIVIKKHQSRYEGRACSLDAHESASI